MRRIGGLIRADGRTSTASQQTAALPESSGVWTVDDQIRLRSADQWPPVQGTLTFQASKDTEIRGGTLPDSVEGSTGVLQIQNNDPFRVLIAFDLSRVPPSATVTSASLFLKGFAYYAPSDTISAYRVTTEWLEERASWLKAKYNTAWTAAGGDYNATVRGSQVVSAVADLNISITSLVQEWVTGTYSNYGVLLRCTETNGFGSGFYSKEYATVADRPLLTVAATW